MKKSAFLHRADQKHPLLNKPLLESSLVRNEDSFLQDDESIFPDFQPLGNSTMVAATTKKKLNVEPDEERMLPRIIPDVEILDTRNNPCKLGPFSQPYADFLFVHNYYQVTLNNVSGYVDKKDLIVSLADDKNEVETKLFIIYSMDRKLLSAQQFASAAKYSNPRKAFSAIKLTKFNCSLADIAKIFPADNAVNRDAYNALSGSQIGLSIGPSEKFLAFNGKTYLLKEVKGADSEKKVADGIGLQKKKDFVLTVMPRAVKEAAPNVLTLSTPVPRNIQTRSATRKMFDPEQGF